MISKTDREKLAHIYAKRAATRCNGELSITIDSEIYNEEYAYALSHDEVLEGMQEALESER